MAELNEKQAAFCREYVVDLNATQAAIRAGYSPKRADSQGPRLLGHVGIQAEIQRLITERQQRTQVTADRVVQELAAIAFADIRQAVRWGPGGWNGGRVDLVDSDALPDDIAAAIGEISMTQNGPKIKMLPKIPALELLGKHLGMFKDQAAESDEPLPWVDD